ncbi:phage holin, LLH family [Paenibacillus maysiensis]|uniref:phage holin, LLH family n=1 Tax=Paenibacillus maysiensis TaxID=1155954 RepID=UPI0004728FA4|nr:phage holin, LLH family [Paenibacillus maysiensis]
MKEQLIEAAQPYVVTIVTALIGLLATIATSALKKAQQKATEYYVSNTSVKDREFLHKVGVEAVAYAESVFKDFEGDKKLQEAIDYVIGRLRVMGLNVTEQEIRAVIEKAVQDYNANTKKSA